MLSYHLAGIARFCSLVIPVDRKIRSGWMMDPYLVATAALLLFAGHETTVNLIGNGMLTLLRHPGILQRLRNEPELIPATVLAHSTSERYGFHGIAWPGVTGRVNAARSGGVPLALIRYARRSRCMGAILNKSGIQPTFLVLRGSCPMLGQEINEEVSHQHVFAPF